MKLRNQNYKGSSISFGGQTFGIRAGFTEELSAEDYKAWGDALRKEGFVEVNGLDTDNSAKLVEVVEEEVAIHELTDEPDQR